MNAVTRAILAAGVVLLLAAPSAIAHTTYSSDGNTYWYFSGMTFDDGVAKDPLNFIFMGGSSDNSDYTRSRIETHMDDDWDTDRVGGRPWRRHDDIRPWCKDDHDVLWVRPGQALTKDKTDWQGTTSRLVGFCGNQHHARFWDDKEHAEAVPGHGRRHQWVVGGIHHEKIKHNLPWTSVGVGHEIDRDWDAVRREMVRAMGKHCADPSWAYHPGADGVIQGFDNFGFLARISLAHKSSGCAGQ